MYVQLLMNKQILDTDHDLYLRMKSDNMLDNKIYLLTKIIFLSSIYDFSDHSNYNILKKIILNLNIQIQHNTISTVSSIIMKNNWKNYSELVYNKKFIVDTLKKLIGKEMLDISFESLKIIKKDVIKEAKKYLIFLYGNALAKPLNMAERLNNANTIKNIYNLGVEFLNEMEELQDTDPVYIIKYLCQRNTQFDKDKSIIQDEFSIYIERIKLMDQNSILNLIKNIIVEKLNKSLMKNFENKLSDCNNLRDLISFIIEYEEKSRVKI